MKKLIKIFCVIFIVLLLFFVGLWVLDESTLPEELKVLRDQKVDEGLKLCGKDEKCLEDFVKKNQESWCADLDKENCTLLKDIIEERFSFKLTF